MTDPPTALQEHWTTIDGYRIFARIGGLAGATATNPIVLIHGFGVSSRYLVPTAERLAPHYPVFAPDFPGSGQSSGPRHALTLPELADFLAKWLRIMEIEQATLLGNSFGCQIITEFAIRYPDLISRAVLVGPTIDPSKRSLPRLLVRLALDAVRERPSVIVLNIRDYVRFGPWRALVTLRIMLRDRIETRLPKMTVPTLIVRGSDDPLVSQGWVEHATSLLPDGELVVVQGSAHAVNYDAPDELANIVDQFMAANRAGR